MMNTANRKILPMMFMRLPRHRAGQVLSAGTFRRNHSLSARDRPLGQAAARRAIPTARIAMTARVSPVGRVPAVSQGLQRPSAPDGRPGAWPCPAGGPGPGAGPSRRSRRRSPVLAAITSGVRTSTARKMPAARCMSSSLDPQNQPSLVRLTITSGRRPAAASRRTIVRTADRQRRLVADRGGQPDSPPPPRPPARVPAREPGRQRREPVEPAESGRPAAGIRRTSPGYILS